ncbi:hypothetical protein V8J82_17605 [Gymnodinialimonas sp. 2305UL16-5]|uniref:hypothetical protein n=1 Tax=Gymnodinialimonas mytili TaxID=3126503 RepID=UPI00309F8B2C
MARIVERTMILDAAPERVFDAVTRPAVLTHIAAPLVRFAPVDPPHWPDRFATGPHLVSMRLFGHLPLGRQVIDVSYPETPPDTYIVRDNGHSALIARWDHWITIQATGDGGAHYTDRVEIEAGWRTAPVAWFATAFYAHRQKRLRRLAVVAFDLSRV